VARLYATSKPAHLTWGVATCQLGKHEGSDQIRGPGKCILRAITGTWGSPAASPSWIPYHLNWIDNLKWDQLLDIRPTRDNLSAVEHRVASVKGYAMFERHGQVYPKGFGAAHYMCFPRPGPYGGILEGKPYPVKAVCTQGSNTS